MPWYLTMYNDGKEGICNILSLVPMGYRGRDLLFEYESLFPQEEPMV
jgi:hypothetical protein